jgi:hypothetical protein
VLHGPHRSRRRREMSCRVVREGSSCLTLTLTLTLTLVLVPTLSPLSPRRRDVASPPATPVSDKACPQRFVGLDVHRDDVVLAAVAADQQLVLPPRRRAHDRFA